ncbi:MAG: DUF2807 domain-containing protein [Flavisolibacter sp.]|nr:DUF2807 domain-containing protein [Flavisolibacter sp.]
MALNYGIELLINQGNEEALAISAETKEYRDAVKTEVVNGELYIFIKQDLEKWWQQFRKKGIQVKAYASFKNLDRINGSSGAKTVIDGSIKGRELSVDLSSGASLTGDVSMTRLDIEQSSGAKSTIRGRVQNLEVSTSSGAQFYGYNLTADNVKADASSGGKMELFAGKEMSVSASSGGIISYKGGGAITALNTSSGGKVRHTS